MATFERPGTSSLERLKFIGEIGELTTTQRIVLLDLFAHAGPDGYAYPSRETIARRCGFGSPISPRTATVTSAMQALERVTLAGEPLIVRHPQGRRANRVRLHPWLCHAPRVSVSNTHGVPPSEDSQNEEARTRRSASSSATTKEHHLAYPSPFSDGEPFDLGLALEAAADILEDCDVRAPRERMIEILESFMDAHDEPSSWSWFAKESRDGVCRIDRARRYVASGDLAGVA